MATIDSPLTGAVPSLGTDAASTATPSTTATEEFVETPSTQTAESEAGTETLEQTPGGSEAEQSPDGRVIPQKYRELFKNDPQLKSLFFSERAYKTAFPTPSEATAARELIDRIGRELQGRKSYGETYNYLNACGVDTESSGSMVNC